MKKLFPSIWMSNEESKEDEPPLKRAKLSFEEMVKNEMNIQEKMSKNSDADQNFDKECSMYEGTGTRSINLDKLFSAINTAQATSTESERVFSTSNRYSTKFRSRLSDKHLSMLVFLKYYFKRNN
jgi:hypothetical protein